MQVLPSILPWLFDGVGGAALIFFVGLMLKWFKSKEHPTGATLTAQGAKVTHSPVASGSGITQTVSETHHHHYGPEAVSPSAQPSSPGPAAEQPRPNLTIVGCRKILIHQGLDGAFHQSEAWQALGEAVVVNVTNDARREANNIGAIVKATLIYQGAGQELLRGMGTWLGEGSGMVRFRVDDSYSVILGLVVNGEFSVPTKRRVT